MPMSSKWSCTTSSDSGKSAWAGSSTDGRIAGRREGRANENKFVMRFWSNYLGSGSSFTGLSSSLVNRAPTWVALDEMDLLNEGLAYPARACRPGSMVSPSAYRLFILSLICFIFANSAKYKSVL